MKSLTRIFRKEWGRPCRASSLVLASVMALLFMTGCHILKSEDSSSENVVTRFFPGGQPAQPEPGELQQGLLQFAESYCLRIVESVDELENIENSPFTPEEALRFKISTVSSVITTATGENLNINLLNMLAMTSLSRMVLENYWVKAPNGEIFESWLKKSQALERKIWRIADKVLTKEQQDEVRQEIDTYFTTLKNPENFFMSHPEDLMIQKHLKQDEDDRSVFSLASINPLSGLDPTVREITQTRLFAERAMFTIQWMPWLIRWQADLLVFETTSQPKIAQTLKDVTSLSESIQRASLAAEQLSETAAALPDQLSHEREAIVTALDSQEGQITTLFEAGSEMSVAVNEAIESIDALMKRFGVGEPHPPRDPNRKRFDILDYAKTADSFTATAEQLNVTLAELNSTLDSPALANLSRQAKADARSILNHFFLLAGGLVLLILASTLVYRKVVRS